MQTSRPSTSSSSHAAAACIDPAHLQLVSNDLDDLEAHYAAYLEQEDLGRDVQCLRSWIEAGLRGDEEAVENLGAHGAALLEAIQSKFKAAARDIQRIDEESPVCSNFSGGRSDRLSKAAETVLHAEEELALALQCEFHPAESNIVSK